MVPISYVLRLQEDPHVLRFSPWGNQERGLCAQKLRWKPRSESDFSQKGAQLVFFDDSYTAANAFLAFLGLLSECERIKE